MAETKEQRLQRLIASLGDLTSSQINWVDGVVQQFSKPKQFVRNEKSTLISQQMLDDWGIRCEFIIAFRASHSAKTNLNTPLSELPRNAA